MNRAVVAILGLLVVISACWAARVKPGPSKTMDQADCIFVGEFIQIAPLKINGHDLRPISISVGTLNIEKVLKEKDVLCTVYKDQMDVIFSNGKSTAYGFGEHCREPAIGQKYYQVAVKKVLEGTFVPAGCFDWITEAK